MPLHNIDQLKATYKYILIGFSLVALSAMFPYIGAGITLVLALKYTSRDMKGFRHKLMMLLMVTALLSSVGMQVHQNADVATSAYAYLSGSCYNGQSKYSTTNFYVSSSGSFSSDSAMSKYVQVYYRYNSGSWSHLTYYVSSTGTSASHTFYIGYFPDLAYVEFYFYAYDFISSNNKASSRYPYSGQCSFTISNYNTAPTIYAPSPSTSTSESSPSSQNYVSGRSGTVRITDSQNNDILQYAYYDTKASGGSWVGHGGSQMSETSSGSTYWNWAFPTQSWGTEVRFRFKAQDTHLAYTWSPYYYYVINTDTTPPSLTKPASQSIWVGENQPTTLSFTCYDAVYLRTSTTYLTDVHTDVRYRSSSNGVWTDLFPNQYNYPIQSVSYYWSGGYWHMDVTTKGVFNSYQEFYGECTDNSNNYASNSGATDRVYTSDTTPAVVNQPSFSSTFKYTNQQLDFSVYATEVSPSYIQRVQLQYCIHDTAPNGCTPDSDWVTVSDDMLGPNGQTSGTWTGSIPGGVLTTPISQLWVRGNALDNYGLWGHSTTYWIDAITSPAQPISNYASFDTVNAYNGVGFQEDVLNPGSDGYYDIRTMCGGSTTACDIAFSIQGYSPVSGATTYVYFYYQYAADSGNGVPTSGWSAFTSLSSVYHTQQIDPYARYLNGNFVTNDYYIVVPNTFFTPGYWYRFQWKIDDLGGNPAYTDVIRTSLVFPSSSDTSSWVNSPATAPDTTVMLPTFAAMSGVVMTTVFVTSAQSINNIYDSLYYCYGASGCSFRQGGDASPTTSLTPISVLDNGGGNYEFIYNIPISLIPWGRWEANIWRHNYLRFEADFTDIFGNQAIVHSESGVADSYAPTVDLGTITYQTSIANDEIENVTLYAVDEFFGSGFVHDGSSTCDVSTAPALYYIYKNPYAFAAGQPEWSLNTDILNNVNASMTCQLMPGGTWGNATYAQFVYSFPRYAYGSEIALTNVSIFDDSNAVWQDLSTIPHFKVDVDHIPPAISLTVSANPTNLDPTSITVSLYDENNVTFVQYGYAVWRDNAFIPAHFEQNGVWQFFDPSTDPTPPCDVQDPTCIYVPDTFGPGYNWTFVDSSDAKVTITPTVNPIYQNRTDYSIDGIIPAIPMGNDPQHFSAIIFVMAIDEFGNPSYMQVIRDILDLRAPQLDFHGLYGTPEAHKSNLYQFRFSDYGTDANGTDWGGSNMATVDAWTGLSPGAGIHTNSYHESSPGYPEYGTIRRDDYYTGNSYYPAGVPIYYWATGCDLSLNCYTTPYFTYMINDTSPPVIDNPDLSFLTGSATQPTNFSLVAYDVGGVPISNATLRYRVQGTFDWIDNGYTFVQDPVTNTYHFSVPAGNPFDTIEGQVEVFDSEGNSALAFFTYTVVDDLAPTVVQSAKEFAIGEAGTTYIGSSTFISFNNTYTDPVVVVTDSFDQNFTLNATTSQFAMVTSIQSDGFWINQTESGGGDGNTTYQLVNYVVFESGLYKYQGNLVYAGHVNVNGNYTSVMLPSAFTDPVVVSSTNSMNNAEPVNSRIGSIGSNSFALTVEANGTSSPSLTNSEQVAFVAVQNGYYSSNKILSNSNGSQYTYPSAYYATPVVIASLASSNDAAPAFAVLTAVNTTYANISVYEPNNLDFIHSNETVSIMAFMPGDIYAEIAANTTFTVLATITDDSPIVSVTFEYSTDGINYNGWYMTEDTFSQYSASVPYTTGDIYIRITAIDSVGNTCIYTFTYVGVSL